MKINPTRSYRDDGNTFEELIEALMAEPSRKDRAAVSEQLNLFDPAVTEERKERD
jgi:hypothetical protein